MLYRLWTWLNADFMSSGPRWWFIVIAIGAAVVSLVGPGDDLLPYWVPDLFDRLIQPCAEGCL
jgi:hypothetical protein